MANKLKKLVLNGTDYEIPNYENKNAVSGGTDLSLVTTGEKYTWNNKLDSSSISDTAYGSGWNSDTTHAPTKNAVYDKISAMDTTIAGKLNSYTIQFAGGWSGGVHPTRFLRVDYNTANSENGVYIKISMAQSHGNGINGRFLQDVIINVGYNGFADCKIYRYFGTEITVTGDYYGNSYGDIFWTVDTTNKIVDFFVLLYQYTYCLETPYMRLNSSTGGTITQYTGAYKPEYSSGTKNWAIIYNFDENTSILTQTEYNNLPSSKTSDNKTYFICETI